MRFNGNVTGYIICFLLVCGSFFSCTVVKDFPEGKPFVFDNKITITGSLDKDEKKRLTNDLVNYWDDSLFARKVQQFGVRYVLKKPPVFDTLNISRTRNFMRSYLNSQGYYNAIFTNLDSSYHFDTAKDNQIRTSINFKIDPGKNTIIDSLVYVIGDHFLDSISKVNLKNSYIKVGKTPFSKQVIASELDRLVALFRQGGYFLLSREDLVAEVDTTDIALLQTVTDPFEFVTKVTEAAERRKQNPTCIVVIRKRAEPDSLANAGDIHFRRYFIGNLYYYPETGRYDQPDSLMTDTASMKRFVRTYHTVYYKKGLFTYRPLGEHTFQRKGAYYFEENFYKTLNNFNQMGAWERVDYRTLIRNDSVDFHYFLTPAKKETLSFNLETSRNTGDFLSSSSLFGIALNTNYVNRNVWHNAIQSSTQFSNGIEFSLDRNNSFLQTFQSSLSHTYSFPRIIAPFKINKSYKLENRRTNLSLSATYSDRKDYYLLRSLVASWGYQWRKKNVVWAYKPINIELYGLDTLPLLEEAFKDNPYLRTSFNTGSVLSQQLSFNVTYPGKKRNVTNYIRAAAEEAGGLLGRINGLQDNIYQYIKFEAEYHKLIQYKKTSIAFRAFSGIGYNYGNNEKFGETLPFFILFFAGGPNSMRAWGLRQLGLGTSIVSDTSSTFRDRYGDMLLEANAEYRFTVAQFSSVKIGGALFSDIGNVWNLHENSAAPGSKFYFKNLGRDVAVGVGTGVRFDFSYFLIRIDMGIKLKDPARSENNGWLKLSDFTWKNYEYSVKDPVTGAVSPPTRNNYAVQLGIGLPF